MLSFILITACCLAAFFFGCWLVVKCMDSSVFWVPAFVYWSILLGAMVFVMAQKTQSGPCITWETQMHYNPALKMMAPARVCTLRGEWVE